MKEIFKYYSIGNFINQPYNKTEFEINRFEDMEDPEVDDVHKHNFYEILWVDKGKSRQTIDYKSYELGERSLFFISPGQLHEFGEWHPLKGGTIMFTESFFLLQHQNKNALFEFTFLDNIYTNPKLKLSRAGFDEIRIIIDLLIKEKKRKVASEAVLQALLHVLLQLIQRNIDSSESRKPPMKYIVLYKNFRSLIEQHFKNRLTVSDYAARLYITQHHLNRICREVTGKTATHVLLERTILEAKRMLSFTDLNISEIAAELGYFDSSHFAKFFRIHAGISPGSFKNKMPGKFWSKE